SLVELGAVRHPAGESSRRPNRSSSSDRTRTLPIPDAARTAGQLGSGASATARYHGMISNSRRDPAMRSVHRVVVLAPDGVYPFELGIPKRVFGTADGRYEVLTCTADGRPVRTSSDFSITVEHGPEALRTADTV